MEKVKKIIIIFVLSILLFTNTANAKDIFATTDDGRKVTLHDNGVWEFIREQKGIESKSAPEDNLKIIEIDSKITETNSTWWKYAWRLTMNSEPLGVQVNANIKFLDKDGFVVDDDYQYGLNIPAKGQKTFTGYKLITASSARNVAQISANISY